ncbi:PIN domain-containing protein [Patescibacteria group bacterium]|nr:PIN domain-containing protein [Patescibacteria group bacterium]
MAVSRKKVVLIDSNVVVYSLNSSHKYFEQALSVYEQVCAGEFKGVLAQQNLLEVYRVLTHSKYQNPMTPQEAIRSIGTYLDVCTLIYPSLTTAQNALNLVVENDLRGNQIFDAYLYSVAVENGVGTLYTANEKDFFYVSKIEVFNPFG